MNHESLSMPCDWARIIRPTRASSRDIRLFSHCHCCCWWYRDCHRYHRHAMQHHWNHATERLGHRHHWYHHRQRPQTQRLSHHQHDGHPCMDADIGKGRRYETRIRCLRFNLPHCVDNVVAEGKGACLAMSLYETYVDHCIQQILPYPLDKIQGDIKPTKRLVATCSKGKVSPYRNVLQVHYNPRFFIP